MGAMELCVVTGLVMSLDRARLRRFSLGAPNPKLPRGPVDITMPKGTLAP